MATGILYAHSGWRWIVILVAIVAIIKMLIGWFGKTKWTNLDQRLGMIFPIALDIQVLLGIVLWIMQQRWLGNDPTASWEHPVTMLIGVAVAHSRGPGSRKATQMRVSFERLRLAIF